MSTPHFINTSVEKYHKNVQGIHAFHVNTTFQEHLGQEMPQKRPRYPCFPCQHHVNTSFQEHLGQEIPQKRPGCPCFPCQHHVNTSFQEHLGQEMQQKRPRCPCFPCQHHVNTTFHKHLGQEIPQKRPRCPYFPCQHHAFHVNTMSTPCKHHISGTARCKQVYLSQDFIENRSTNRRANGNFEYICLI